MTETAARIKRREQTALQVLEETRDSWLRANPAINAFAHVDWDAAEAEAAAVDRDLLQGHVLGPLAGVPFAVKDLQDAAGMPTQRGSLLHKEDAPATTDSPSVARLRRAGAIAIGKTTTAEYGMDSATSTRAFGVTRNPWDTRLTPGGSSGGSAAAVSSGIVPFATGTDEGGSIRSPAAFCGLVGLKTTHGLIPRAGGISDTNVEGVLTRTVEDSILLHSLMQGAELGDKMSTVGDSRDVFSGIQDITIEGLRAVWSPDLGHAAVEPEIVDRCRAAYEALVSIAGLRDVDRRPRFEDSPLIWMRTVARRFRLDLMARGIYPLREHELSDAARSFLEFASGVTDRHLGEARIARERLEAQVAAFFSEADVLVTPAVACAPFAAEGPAPSLIGGVDASLVGPEPFSMIANLTWIPAISFPIGLDQDGLPIGLQILAKWKEDGVLLRLADIWERVSPWPRGPAG